MPSTVRLIALRAEHRDELTRLFRDNDVPAVTRYFDPFPLDAEMASRLARHAGRDLYWGVWENSSLVGLAMVRGAEGGHPDLAYGLLVDQSAHGRGLGKFATELMLDELCRRGVKAVRARVHVGNKASLRMLTANGFRELACDGGRILLECLLGDAGPDVVG